MCLVQSNEHHVTFAQDPLRSYFDEQKRNVIYLLFIYTLFLQLFVHYFGSFV